MKKKDIFNKMHSLWLRAWQRELGPDKTLEPEEQSELQKIRLACGLDYSGFVACPDEEDEGAKRYFICREKDFDGYFPDHHAAFDIDGWCQTMEHCFEFLREGDPAADLEEKGIRISSIGGK